MYTLVLLKPSRSAANPETIRRHEEHITTLIRQNRILLGGCWNRQAGPFSAAYLLKCDSLELADELVARDPYVSEDIFDAEIVEWQLVGINPETIDEALVLLPTKA